MRVAPALKSLLEQPDEARYLGPFKLIRKLGSGGFAPVWLAHEVYGGVTLREAAVKLFPVESTPDQARAGWVSSSALATPNRQRVIDEARSLCRVEHPNVVRFYAMQLDDARGVLGLAMELVAGRSLDTKIAEAGKLPLREALDVGQVLASALATVHRAGLVHRDVKPQNVVEAAGTYKLIDFGIAAAEQPAAPPSKRRGVRHIVLDDVPIEIGTKMSQLPEGAVEGVGETMPASSGPNGPWSGFGVAGTLGYLDPECVANPGTPAVASSDIYALGTLLFECLTGALPAALASASGTGLDAKVLDGREAPPSLRQVLPDVLPEVATLVDAMLAPRRSDRPQSAEAVALEIERIRSQLAGRERVLPPEEIGPFRGLSRFEAEDRDVFFGRTSEVAALLELMRSRAAVALVGASGTGKSSLARAGVLPAVAEGALGGWPRVWDTVVITPGEDPAARLDEVIAKRVDRAVLSTDGVMGALAEVAKRTERGLVLLVDQAEELVTLASESSRARTIDLLALLTAQVVPGLRVVFAVRQDLLDEVVALPQLGTVVMRAAYVVQQLPDVAWRDVLSQALDAYGYGFEDEALQDELMVQLRGAASAMPLAQFALSQLWARRDIEARKITRAALLGIGGVAGALERHAELTREKILAKHDGVERAIRNLLLSMTTAQGTREWVTTAQAIEAANDPGESGGAVIGATESKGDSSANALVGPAARVAVDVLAMLEKARLVVRERDRLTIAHEALLTRWTRLRVWLDEVQADRHLAEEIERDAARWDTGVDGFRDETLLWRRHRLATAIEFRTRSSIPLSSTGQAFLDAGARLERRGDRARYVAIGALIVASVAISIGVGVHAASLDQQRSSALAGAMRGRCESARAERLLAASYFADGRVVRAVEAQRHAEQACPAQGREASLALVDMLVALGDTKAALAEARRLESSPEIPASVQRTAKEAVLLLNVPPPSRDVIEAARKSIADAKRDGSRETAASKNREAIQAGLDDPMALYEAGLYARLGGQPVEARRYFDRVLSVLDRAGSPVTPLVPPSYAPLRSVVWPAAAPAWIIGSASTHVVQWHPLLSAQLAFDGAGGTGAPAGQAGLSGVAAASESARQIAIVASDASLRWWEPGSGHPIATLDARGPVSSAIAVSRDGKKVAGASASTEGAVSIWTDRGGKPFRVELPVAQATSLAFSPDGSRLAVAAESGGVTLWDIASSPVNHAFRGLDGPATSVDVSARHVVAGARSGELVIWRISSEIPLLRLPARKAPITSVTLSGDGRWVASASRDGAVQVHDVESGAVVMPAFENAGGVSSVAFSPDGRWLITTPAIRDAAAPSPSLDEATLSVWSVRRGERVGRLGLLGEGSGYFLSTDEHLEVFGASILTKLRCESTIDGERKILEFVLCEDRFVVPGLLSATLTGEDALP